MADEAFLDGEGLTQVVTWLRDKDVGQYTDESKTNEIFNDYSNNKAKGNYNHAEGYNTQAIGSYNHAEGYNTTAGSYQNAYYRYCGNPILQVESGTSIISKATIDSNNYQISGKTGAFSLDSIELPEDFTVGKYSSELQIFDYNYVFNNDNWYTTQITNIETTDELNSLFTTLFENNSNINRKIYMVSEEPTEVSDDLYIYNGAIYCSAFMDNKITVSEDTINVLTTINTLESQKDNYITTLYVNESNTFGFIYYLADDSLILFKQEYDINNIITIINLTNNYGTFKKIDKVYQSAPTITTQLGLVCGTSFNSTTTPQYYGKSGKWEYLNEYNVVLTITESDRTVYDSEGNPTDVVNPSLIVTYNDEILINKTVDFATDTLDFIYNKNEEEIFNWYLDGSIVDLSEYGISVENQQEYDIISFELNKVYISYDSEGNQIEKNQEEFYNDNHASGTTSYIFNGTASGNWVKIVKDGAIGNTTYCHAEGYKTIATGTGAHVEGGCYKEDGTENTSRVISISSLEPDGEPTEVEIISSRADGIQAHAEGTQTYAYGYSSHAEGYQTIVTGPDSHAEGIQTQVAGSGCHAEGLQTKVHAGTANHVEGLSLSIADGTANHAEGMFNTISNGLANHNEGMSNIISSTGNCNHAEGNGHYIYNGTANHAEGYGHHINETTAGDYNSVRNYANTTDGNYASDICCGTNKVKGCKYTSVSGQSNTVTNDYASIISGMNNTTEGGWRNIIGGDRNELQGGLNIISGQGNKVSGNVNIIVANGETVNGSYNLISGLNSTALKGDGNIIGGTAHSNCSGDNNLIFGDVNSVSGNQNIIGGTSNKIVTIEKNKYSRDNAIFGSINSIYSGESSIIGGTYNTSYNSFQFIFGTSLQSGNTDTINSARSALVIGECNENCFTDTEYVLTNDTIYYDTHSKTYYYIKNDEYYKIEILSNTTPNSNWYELVNDEYIKTQDKEMIENKEYYYRYSDTDYRLIKIKNTEITQPIYEIKQYIMIAGNGIYDNRSNALELDYQGNLQTSGDIINGDGVVLGAYISNEKIDEIWDNIFGGGRVCLVQTSS